MQNYSLETETKVTKEESKNGGAGRTGKTKTDGIKNPGTALTAQVGLQGVKKKKEREAHKLYAQSEGKSMEGYITKINVSICHLAISY